MDLVDWIEESLKRTGKTRAGLAGVFGVHPSQITRLLKAGRRLKVDELKKIADYLGEPIPDFWKNERPLEALPAEPRFAEPPSPPLTQEPPPAVAAHNDGEIIVYDGATAAGKDYSYALEREAGRVPRPQGLMGRAGVYAVRITDDSMAPAHAKDDLVFIDARAEVRAGDEVTVELYPDPREIGARRYFRRLVDRDQKRYLCRRLHPAGDQSFAVEDVKVIQRVIPAREVNGH
ncbi:LexA family transcriptional regulator [Methylocella silvestris]|uniref:HTH cro/C1-type domain-containing protein n=1 Tax=Methylocella silvestris TaxID=199596 RepID=A0A2J7TJS8_METSI|nr:S24 family peptidase [Methylocella silvestris]PNG27028.1 hypothetical protein CR492_04810 [Methylocella silvestris]